MKKIFIIFFSLVLLHTTAFSQNNLCESSFLFCTNSVNNYPAGVNTGTAQAGADYTCLGTQPNPAWYYMEVLETGPIHIYMSSTPSVDIDFSLWGPFTDQTTPCLAQLTAGTTVDCSYSTSWNETADIPNAHAGQFYILLICNYSNQACNINFLQQNAGQPGAGLLNCININIDSNSVLCIGQTLNLTCQSTPVSFSYYWTGPNGFISTLQNPVIDSVTMANAGEYYLQVINGTDTSDAISTTIIINPIPYVNLGDDIVLCSNVTMVLNAGSGFDNYIWKTDAFSQTIAYTQTIPVSASIYGLGTHKLWVKVSNMYGCVNTDTVLVSFQDCSDIDEIFSHEIKIYPNPSNEFVTVEFPEYSYSNTTIEILDITGRMVLSDVVNTQKQSTKSFSIKHLNTGIYIIKLTNNEGVFVKKLFIE